MTDLIQRLAEGPGSRELSDEVLLALGWKCDQVFDRPFIEPKGRNVGSFSSIPSPTESVDDALALVPEGMIWRMEGPDNFYVVIGRPTAKGNFSQATGKWQSYGAQSLALAICIAVLKSV